MKSRTPKRPMVTRRGKLSEEQETLVSHFLATTMAFQNLVWCLQENGTLERGHFQDTLAASAKAAKKTNPMVADMLADLRNALLD